MKTKFLTTFVLWLAIAVAGTGKEALSISEREGMVPIDSSSLDASESHEPQRGIYPRP